MFNRSQDGTLGVWLPAPSIDEQIASLGACGCGARLVLVRPELPQPSRFHLKRHRQAVACALGERCPHALAEALRTRALLGVHDREAKRAERARSGDRVASSYEIRPDLGRVILRLRGPQRALGGAS
jgi:hypothetical protein